MSLNPIQRLRLWLTRAKAQRENNKFGKTPRTAFQATTLAVPETAATVMLSGVRLVFGLDWNPLRPGVPISESLQEARNAGYNYSALMVDESLVGLARDIGPGSGKAYSAVLMMVEQLSSAEVEVYIFQIGQQVSFIGLVNSKPIAGFDLLLPGIAQALEVLAEFRSIHVGHDIRIVTNLKDELPSGEHVRLENLLPLLTAPLMVRRLINRPLRLAITIVLIVIAAAAGAIAWYLYEQAEERHRQEEAARIAQESDPNYIYEQAINSLLSNIGTPGNSLLQQWREMVAALPLKHAGWVLSTVECRAIGCKATWDRFHGNFKDFDKLKPSNAIEEAELNQGDADNQLNITLVTHHQLPPKAIASSSIPIVKNKLGLDRQALPLLRDATLQWGSLLQDWSLVGVNVKLSKPVLFGPSSLTDPAPIHKAVMMLHWEIADDVWSLPAVNLPDDAIPESLLVNVSGLKPNYKLTGALYAKFKKF